MEEKDKKGCGCTHHAEEHSGCGCNHTHTEGGCECGHGHHGHEHHYAEGEVGCGCHHEYHEDEPVNIVKLIDDEGKPHECLHIATLELNGNWYAIFQAMEEDDADEDTVTILQIVEENDEERLMPIDDQAVLDAVFEEFCRLMDEEEDEEE